MNNIKNIFSIRDLENLSGIKAHTIRIWEKRYNVLAPMRTDSNIRYYDVNNLQKLLNITLLHNHGYKISKISKFPEERIPVMVREIISKKSARHHAVNAFKMAMMNFDQQLFFTTYDTLLAEKSFREVFYEVMIPLLGEIGMLWQTETIKPAHEHFISYLIKQKILVNTEKLLVNPITNEDRVFVLFLPENEIHELGLMYINYEIIRHGYKSIYLGESVPMDNLSDLRKFFNNITFVSYFTVEPVKTQAREYIDKLSANIMEADSKLWLLGTNTELLQNEKLPEQVTLFESIEALIGHLEQ